MNRKRLVLFLLLMAAALTHDIMQLMHPSQPAPPTPDPIIYITQTGAHYHYDRNCNGGTYIRSTLPEAEALGLTPCALCIP